MVDVRQLQELYLLEVFKLDSHRGGRAVCLAGLVRLLGIVPKGIGSIYTVSVASLVVKLLSEIRFAADY